MNNLPGSLNWSPVTAITRAKTEECLCITVSHPSRCYVTRSGIVTHNSDTSSPAEGLPRNLRNFLDAMLAGQPIQEAATTAGVPVDRAEYIAGNIGQYFASVWKKQGVDEESAMRQLAQRAQEQPLGSGKRSASASTNPLAPVARASFNHADRWLTKTLSGLAESAKLPEVLAKIADVTKSVPFFSQAIHLLKQQGMPLSHIPQEALALMRDMQIKKAFGKELAMDVHRSLTGKSKFTDIAYPDGFAENPAQKKQLYLAMTGELPMNTLSPELQELGKRLRKLLTDAGEEAVRQGRMSPDTLLALQDQYLPHYYADDQKNNSIWSKATRLLGLKDVLAQRSTAWHIVDTTRKDPRQPDEYALVNWDDKGTRWRFNSAEHRDAFLESFTKDQALQYLQADGREVTNMLAALTPEQKREARAEIKLLTREKLDRKEKLSPAVRGVVNQAIRQMRQRFEARAPLSVEQQEKAGLIFDPVYSTVKYLAQMHSDNAVAEFFNGVASRSEWTTDTATDGYRQIPDNRRYGKLAGQYVLNPIADQVLAMVGDESPLMELYDDLMRAWSAGKTVWNPGTHVRNVLGNIPFSQLAGASIHNPANWSYYRDAVSILRKGGDSLKEMYEAGLLGADYSSQELRSALRELLPDASLMGEEPAPKMMARVTRAMFGKLPATAQRGAIKTSAFVNGVYSLTDDWFKAAAFLKAKDMGMTATEATAHVRTWFPFYDNIGSSSGIKFARRIFPFLSFFRESARIFGNALKERPLSLAGSMIMPYVFTQIAMALLGLKDDDKEEVLKDMRGKLIFKGLTGDAPAFAMLLPWKSQGKLAQFDLSNIMPFASFLGRPLESGQEDDFIQHWAKKILTSAPVGNTIVSIGTNQDPFSGRNLVEDDMTDAEKAYARAKHVWMLLAPPLLGTSAQVLANTAERSTNKTLEKRSMGQAFLRAVVGLDVRNASPDLYRLADYYRKEHGLELNKAWSGSTDAQQRARKRLFAAIIQDEPDIPEVAKILTFLKTSGEPVATNQDLNQLLFYKNPIMILKGKEHQTRFRSSLTGESRKVLEDALSEFKRIEQSAPRVLAEARRLMK